MKSKIVVITGCSSGIGRMLVSAYLKAGFVVVATMRNVDARREGFSSELRDYASQLHLLECDVTEPASRVALKNMIEQKFQGQIDILVNNAGCGYFGPFEGFTEADIRAQFEVNFFGVLSLTTELLPMLRKTGAKIFNLSSVLGYHAMPMSSIYSASKFAIEGWSESLRFELKAHGVQVIIVEPGAFRTNFDANIKVCELKCDVAKTYAGQYQAYARMRTKMRARPGRSGVVVVNAILRASLCRKSPLRIRCGVDAHALHYLKKCLPNCVYSWVGELIYGLAFKNTLQIGENKRG